MQTRLCLWSRLANASWWMRQNLHCVALRIPIDYDNDGGYDMSDVNAQDCERGQFDGRYFCHLLLVDHIWQFPYDAIYALEMIDICGVHLPQIGHDYNWRRFKGDRTLLHHQYHHTLLKHIVICHYQEVHEQFTAFHDNYFMETIIMVAQLMLGVGVEPDQPQGWGDSAVALPSLYKEIRRHFYGDPLVSNVNIANWVYLIMHEGQTLTVPEQRWIPEWRGAERVHHNPAPFHHQLGYHQLVAWCNLGINVYGHRYEGYSWLGVSDINPVQHPEQQSVTLGKTIPWLDCGRLDIRDDMPSLDHDTLPLVPITISDQQGDTLHRRLWEPYIVRGCAPRASDQIYYYGRFRPTREEVVQLNSWDRRGSFECREWIQWASGISWSAHIIGQTLSKRYPQDHDSTTLGRRGGQPIAYNRPDMDALSNTGLAICHCCRQWS